jgi:hypothetical protein
MYTITFDNSLVVETNRGASELTLLKILGTRTKIHLDLVIQAPDNVFRMGVALREFVDTHKMMAT